jgi:hypothetical protein
VSGLDGLVEAMGCLPRLDGCKCRGLHRLFTEPETIDDIADAEALRGFCPARSQCADWYESSPGSQKPRGCVVAGQWRPEPRPRKREEPA